ncbi:hypothetical protein PUN4_570036 [Paraburkholderia unamae]|nr:hypothetical protein PUN4_570036 [Paraburkholderia unamae]
MHTTGTPVGTRRWPRGGVRVELALCARARGLPDLRLDAPRSADRRILPKRTPSRRT